MRVLPGGHKPFSPPIGDSSHAKKYKDVSFGDIADQYSHITLPYATQNMENAPYKVFISNNDINSGIIEHDKNLLGDEAGAVRTRVDVGERTKFNNLEKKTSIIPERALSNKNAATVWKDEETEGTGLQKNIAAVGSKSALGDNDKTVPHYKNYLEARTGTTYKDPKAGNPIRYNTFGPVLPSITLPGQERGAYPILSMQGLGTQNVPSQAYDIHAPLIDLSSPKQANVPSFADWMSSRHLTSEPLNINHVPSAPPMPASMSHLMDVDSVPPEKPLSTEALEKFIKSEILLPFSKGTQRPLPLLVERHKTMGGNGDNVIDASPFYHGNGYSANYYDLGQGLNKILDGLNPFLSKEEKAPQKPARAFLEKYKIDLEDLDTFFSRNSNNFLLNDYTHDDMENLYKIMDSISVILDKGQKFQKQTEAGEVVEEESFEDYLKKLPVPQGDHVALAKPFNETMKEALTGLSAIGKTYKTLIEKPSTGYIERVLVNKKFAQDVKKNMEDISKSPEAQDPVHRESIGKLTESGGKFVKALEDVIKYVETTSDFKSAHVEVGLEKIDTHCVAFQKQIGHIADALGTGKFGNLEETNHEQFLNPYIHLVHNINNMMDGALGDELGHFMMRKLAREEEAKKKENLDAKKSVPSQGGMPPSPPPSPPSSPSGKKDDKKLSPEDQAKMNEDYKVLSSEEFYRKYLNSLPKPDDMVRPLADNEIQRPAVFDDSHLREIQQMSEWADYANKMSQKLKLLDNIGNTIQDLAMLGTSRPDPEYVALARRWRRLSDLLDIAKEVPKCNKMTQQIEQASLEAQHDYIRGVGTLLTARLKSRTEEANQKVMLDQMAARGAVNLAAKAMETELLLSKHAEKIFNMFMQIQDMRDMNTWDRIKHMVKAFKW